MVISGWQRTPLGTGIIRCIIILKFPFLVFFLLHIWYSLLHIWYILFCGKCILNQWMIDLPYFGTCLCLNLLFILQKKSGIWCCWEVYLSLLKLLQIPCKSVDALLYSWKWRKSRVYSLVSASFFIYIK